MRFDFRSRFNLSWGDIPERVSWIEAMHLVSVLLRDPESWLCAAFNGWKHPVSREWMVLAEQVDLTIRLNKKKGTPFKPMPRPWPAEGSAKTGKTTLAPADAKALLRRHREGA